MKLINRGIEDNLLFFNAFQDNFLWMEEIGFYKTYVSSVINREILILRYIGSFFWILKEKNA